MHIKASLEKKNKNNESDPYDLIIKNLKDKKQDKFYWPRVSKRISEHEDKLFERHTLEQKEIEKMREINESVKIV